MKASSFLLPFTFLTLLSVAGGVRADDDDPELRGRKLSEWIEMLRGDYAGPPRQVALLALGSAGSAASDRAIWLSTKVQQQRTGLLAVELIRPGKSRRVVPAIS